MGDGILLYFGYPRAHEDDAARAVAAALDLVEAVKTLRASVIAKPLHVRVGIATGDAVVGDLLGTGAAQERAAVGVVPNLAARLLAKLQGEAFTSRRFFCSADHVDSTLHPLLARIERAADFKRDDSSDRKLEKLEALLSWSRDRVTDVVLLADLLSIPTKG